MRTVAAINTLITIYIINLVLMEINFIFCLFNENDNPAWIKNLKIDYGRYPFSIIVFFQPELLICCTAFKTVS